MVAATSKCGEHMTTGDSSVLPAEATTLVKNFVGVWDVEGEMDVVGESKAPISGVWTYREVADGIGVSGHLATTIEGVGTIEEAELIGYDIVGRRLHMFSMNALAVRDHVGDWESDDRLKVTYRETANGTDASEEISIIFERPGLMHAKVVEFASGSVVVRTHLDLTRRP